MSSDFKEDQRPRRLLVQDESRLRDVEEKHQKVRELLAGSGADALLLQDPETLPGLLLGRICFASPGKTSQQVFL